MAMLAQGAGRRARGAWGRAQGAGRGVLSTERGAQGAGRRALAGSPAPAPGAHPRRRGWHRAPCTGAAADKPGRGGGWRTGGKLGAPGREPPARALGVERRRRALHPAGGKVCVRFLFRRVSLESGCSRIHDRHSMEPGNGVPGGGLPAGAASSMTKLAEGVWGWAGAEQVNAACAAVSRVRVLAQNVRGRVSCFCGCTSAGKCSARG